MSAGPSTTSAACVHVVLPAPLRELAHLDGDVRLELSGSPTQRALLDALEVAYPVLGGTIRDRHSGRRRAFLRFFAAGEDRSLDDPDDPLPPAVVAGTEPFIVMTAIAGG